MTTFKKETSATGSDDTGHDESNVRIKNFPEIATPTMLQIFEIFFPMVFIKEVMLPERNK